MSIEFPQINEGVKSPYRWYNSKTKWNMARAVCQGDCMYKLISPTLVTLPFQIYGQGLEPPFGIAWVIYDLDNNPILTVDENTLRIVKIGDYWYFISDGTYIEGRTALSCGYYYSQITIVDNNAKVIDWFSEIFYVDLKANLFFETPALEDATQCLPVLQWWNDCGMVGNIYYGTIGFSNLFYLDAGAIIAEIQPQITLEGFEDGNKQFIAAFKKRITRYRIDIGLVPPYVVESLGEMILHENIRLTLPFGQGAAMLKNVLLDVEHEKDGNGCYALASITFEIDDVTVVDKCCADEADEQPCLGANIFPLSPPQEVSCPIISTATGWTSSGASVCNDGTVSDSYEQLYQNCFVSSATYRIVVIVDGYVSGSADVYFGGGLMGSISANGTYYYIINGASGSKLLEIIPSAFNGCIGATIEVINSGISTNNAWTFGDDGYCYKSGSTGILQYQSNIQPGNKYRVTVSVTVTSGSISLNFGGVVNSFSQTGTYSLIIDASNTDVFFDADTFESVVCVNSIEACMIQ